MGDEIRDLLLSGFMIYPSAGKFIVKKESVPSSQYQIEPHECDSYVEAIELAAQLLRTPREVAWAVTVRYNRGLGIEYKNLSDVIASSKEIALQNAEILAENHFKKQKVMISGVKVQPKIDDHRDK